MGAILHYVQYSIVALLPYILRSWESNILYMHMKVVSVIKIFVFYVFNGFGVFALKYYRLHTEYTYTYHK
jgi:hypothetical protein